MLPKRFHLDFSMPNYRVLVFVGAIEGICVRGRNFERLGIDARGPEVAIDYGSA
jgi:hypothetical protein